MAKHDYTQAEIDALMQRVDAAKLPQTIGWFKSYLDAWQVELSGPKVTGREINLAKLLYMPKREGVELAFVAMLCRKGGATDAEHTAAFNCKTAHNNAFGRTGMTVMGVVSRRVEGKPYRYFFDVTTKGYNVITTELDKLDQVQPVAKAPSKPKPVTGKAKPKPKGNVAPAETPISEGPTVTMSLDTEHAAVTQADLSALALHFNN